jgi:tRNA A-37 threonylcarbamoyl transferase component Bud32
MHDLTRWPSLEAAWEMTESAGSGQAADGIAWEVLQNKPRTRVLRLEAPNHQPRAVKIYAVPGHLAPRSFGMSSRANREFTVMMEASRHRLPVARPRHWQEQRFLGCLRFSALTLDCLDGPDLERLMTELEPAADREPLARMAGDVLGRFHRAGLYWGTAAPRNLMLTHRDDVEPLRAIDFPYATMLGDDITGSDEAMLDLACLLRLRNGDIAFGDEARRALLEAYCAGDSTAARELDERIVLRGHLAWKGKRLNRRVRNLLRRGSRSSGRGGQFDPSSGRYEPLKGGAVRF